MFAICFLFLQYFSQDEYWIYLIEYIIFINIPVLHPACMLQPQGTHSKDGRLPEARLIFT